MNNRRRLLSQIFSDGPASYGENYVESTLNDIRYQLNASQGYGANFTREEPIKTNWLRNDRVWGPYEKSVLDTILNDGDNVIVFRSGTGSGKSSLVNILTDRAKQLCRFSQNRKWSETTGLETFFCKIDLQDSQSFSYDRYRKSENKPEAPHNIDLDSFYREISQQIVNDVSEQVAPQLMMTSPFEDFISDDLLRSRDEIIVKKNLKAQVGTNSIHELAEVASIWLTATQDIKPNKLLGLSLAFASSLVRPLKTSRNESVILCLDNTDRLYTPYLEGLLNAIKSSYSSPTIAESGLKTTLFMRISSSRDAINALPDSSHFRELSAPEALDIVVPKILAFLYHRAELEVEYSKSVLNDVQFRLVEFLIRLNDPFDSVDEILSAVSGSNIRTYFSQTVKLLASDDFKPRITNERQYNAAMPNVQNLAIDLVIYRLGYKIIQCIEHSLDESNGSISNANALRLFCESSSSEIAASLLSAVTSTVEGGIVVRARHLASAEIVRMTVNRIREADGFEQLFFQKFFAKLIEEGLRGIDPKIIQLDFGRLGKNRATGRFFGLAEENVDRAIRELDIGSTVISGEELAKFAKLFLTFAASFSVEQMNGNEDVRSLASRLGIGKRRLRSFIGTVVGIKRHELPEPRQTRYSVAKVILEESMKTGPNFMAFNLFGLDNRSYCPAGLYILYYLGSAQRLRDVGEQIGDVKLGELRTLCAEQGISDQKFNLAVSGMMAIDNRLIYSTVDDSEFSVNSGPSSRSNDNSAMYISWAGWRFYSELIENPHYIQWALSKVSELRLEIGVKFDVFSGNGITDQLPFFITKGELPETESSVALRTFFLLLRDRANFRMSRPLNIEFLDLKNRESTEIINCNRYPEIDIFMKNLPDLVSILDYHARNSSGPTRQELLSIRKRCLLTGRSIARWYLDTFDGRCETWDLLLGASISSRSPKPLTR